MFDTLERITRLHQQLQQALRKNLRAALAFQQRQRAVNDGSTMNREQNRQHMPRVHLNGGHT